MSNHEWPPVSVVMPIYNEAATIERSLRAMLAQDYPGPVEVICVDGLSDDGTREIIGRIAAEDPRVRLVSNPRRIIPAAMNIGFREARYGLVARMDGHTFAPPDYLRRCVEVLQESGAECVGGRWEYVADTYMARVIAAAMESRFGVGPGRWRGAKEAGEADTVPYGLWVRDRVLALGGFDETLLVNEDYELAYRLRQAGGRIYYSPDIRTDYHPRRSLKALWKQYFRYGFWKARMLRMHPRSVRLRHVVAPLFVVGLVAGAVLSFFGSLWRWLYGLALAAYALLVLFFSLRQAARHGWRVLPLLPFAFATLHLAWGAGFLKGVWRWWIRRDDEQEESGA